MNKVDRIIWLDGHTSTMASEEAFLRSKEVYTDDGNEWHMTYADAEFVWKANCWMQIK